MTNTNTTPAQYQYECDWCGNSIPMATEPKSRGFYCSKECMRKDAADYEATKRDMYRYLNEV